LDPSVQTAVERPAKEEKKAGEIPYMLERLVVKERAELPLRRRAVEDPTGPFGPFSGGRFYRRDSGPVRIELGLWPNIDIFDEEARFAGQKTKAEFDVVRVKW
jgi:hypothetical protein